MKSIYRVAYAAVMFCVLVATGCASFDAISTLNKTEGAWQNKVLVKGSQDYNDYLAQYKVLSSPAVEAVQKFSEPDYIYADDISRSYFAWKESKRMLKVGWSERKEMKGYIPQIEYFVKNGKQMTREELQKLAAKPPVIANGNEIRTYKEKKDANGIARKEQILNNKFPMSDKFPKHYQFCANIQSGLSYDYVMEILNGKMKTDMPREVWDRMEEYKKQGISVIRTTSNGADVDLLFKDKVLYAARIEFENPVGLPLVVEKYRKQFGITESLKKHSDSNPLADINNASDAFTLFRKTRVYTLSNSDVAVETAYFIFGGLVGYDENRLTAMSAFGSDVEKVKFMGDLMKLTPDGKADLIVDADFKIIRQTGIGKTLFDTIQQQGLFEKLKTHKAEVDAETAPVSYVLITDKKLLEYINGIEKVKAEQEAIEKAKEAKAKEKAALDF